jgi:hypothetical protein
MLVFTTTRFPAPDRRNFGRRLAHRPRQLRQGFMSALLVEPELAAKQATTTKVSQHHVRIGNRWQ